MAHKKIPCFASWSFVCRLFTKLMWHWAGLYPVPSKIEQCAELAFCLLSRLLRFAAPENYYKQLGIIIGNNSRMNIIKNERHIPHRFWSLRTCTLFSRMKALISANRAIYNVYTDIEKKWEVKYTSSIQEPLLVFTSVIKPHYYAPYSQGNFFYIEWYSRDTSHM